MLLGVLFVMVGEQVHGMQLAGWIGTSGIGVDIPGWAGRWFSIFPNAETFATQVAAVRAAARRETFALGSSG